MKLLALLSLLILMLQEAGTASLSKEERGEDQPHGEGDSYTILHLGDYVLSLDNYDEVIDPSSYDELTDYGDQLPQVKGTSLASLTRTRFTQSTEAARTLPSNPTTMARSPTLGRLAAPTNH
ncbi:opticin-like, partial [Oryx dammah]|uniref:opticin-like n=1 Tax=Oryx dammah TaxID=59534 RepID=UPI001A9B9678